MKWNWNQNLINLSSSIRAYEGLPVYHPCDPDVSNWLNEHDKRCVIVILIDGMGSRILENHLSKDAFFRHAMMKEISTVYPPTTSAATTSLMTGKTPAENGWLGWNQYFHELDDSIILFYGKGMYSRVQYNSKTAYEALPIHFTQDELRANGIHAESVWPAWGAENPCQDYGDLLETAARISKEPDTRYLYVYWDGLDTLMHMKGPSALETGMELERLNQLTEQWIPTLPEDVSVIITADHGQVEVNNIDLRAYPDVMECLERFPTIEGRTCAFYVKSGMHETFADRFLTHFSEDFELLTHDEVIHEQIFGPGTPHPRFEEFIGDYLALAKTDACLICSDRQKLTIGNHAGTLIDEAMIPVILLDGKTKFQ